MKKQIRMRDYIFGVHIKESYPLGYKEPLPDGFWGKTNAPQVPYGPKISDSMFFAAENKNGYWVPGAQEETLLAMAALKKSTYRWYKREMEMLKKIYGENSRKRDAAIIRSKQKWITLKNKAKQ